MMSSFIADHRRGIIIFMVIAGAVLLALFAYEVRMLRTAHSTFDNYYAFRGCEQLLSKTDTYGTCALPSGQVIKIVEFNGRWYLDGDMPICWHNVCI